jgi:ActR/RegA family two-component response regulator
MAPQILIVNPDTALSASLVPQLNMGGFAVMVAADFDEAVRALKDDTFYAVVTAHRLGSHNGLHLILRAQADHPDVLSIVTSTVRDHLLEAEAGAFGAVYLVAPWHNAAELLRALESTRSQAAGRPNPVSR